jgi:segregation and condensation protein B
MLVLLAADNWQLAADFMSLRPQLEAIIYAAETPISIDQIYSLVKESVLAETPELEPAEVKSRIRATLEELIADYSGSNHGIEIRQVAGGYRMSTKPDQHDVVRAFAKSLKPPFRLSLPALETLAVIAYKQPVTVPEISEIRGVDSGGVIATLLDRKLIGTAGRKAVIGRPILYKTSKEFLLRFGLKDVNELPSMEEFEKLLAESFQSDLLPKESSEGAGLPETPFEAAMPDDEFSEDTSSEGTTAPATDLSAREESANKDKEEEQIETPATTSPE